MVYPVIGAPLDGAVQVTFSVPVPDEGTLTLTSVIRLGGSTSVTVTVTPRVDEALGLPLSVALTVTVYAVVPLS